MDLWLCTKITVGKLGEQCFALPSEILFLC